MKKKFFCCELIGLAGMLFFVACSNSATETTVYHNDDIAVLESGKKLKKQTFTRSFQLLFMFIMDLIIYQKRLNQLLIKPMTILK